MKHKLVSIILVLAMMMSTTCMASASTDYDLAKDYMNKHCKGGHITTLNTTAKGGFKGKVKGGGTVRYPKKVKKGKKVKVYLVFKKGESECDAMVCLGRVK